MRAFPAVLLADRDGGFRVTFHDVPEAIAEGDNSGGSAITGGGCARIGARDVDCRGGTTHGVVRGRAGRGIGAALGAGMAKTALYDAMREQGVDRAELARRLRWHLPQSSRVVDLRHASLMEQVEVALAGSGPKGTRGRGRTSTGAG